ncbi:hypothetical protein LMG23992_04587 [Cupriavidus laharis]|uniref:Uncharacterized protein n=1 Tax=Cupriavidus laharis TaxID=151654 RepID=A0ABM8XNG8_9BURK|nr:hypothetical protein LMG23992_04587 [Cupriavidus laharis]
MKLTRPIQRRPRAGGDPAAFAGVSNTLDSRLRGNDGEMRGGKV